METYFRLQVGVFCLKFVNFDLVIICSSDTLLEIVDGIIWLLGLLVEGDQRLGQELQHAGLLKILLELLLLGILRHLCTGHCSN